MRNRTVLPGRVLELRNGKQNRDRANFEQSMAGTVGREAGGFGCPVRLPVPPQCLSAHVSTGHSSATATLQLSAGRILKYRAVQRLSFYQRFRNVIITKQKETNIFLQF